MNANIRVTSLGSIQSTMRQPSESGTNAMYQPGGGPSQSYNQTQGYSSQPRYNAQPGYAQQPSYGQQQQQSYGQPSYNNGYNDNNSARPPPSRPAYDAAQGSYRPPPPRPAYNNTYRNGY